MRIDHLRPTGITWRITLLGWLVTLVTLAVFVLVLVPEQKREFERSLESKARGVAVSIRGVAAGAAVSADYSAVVDQAMQVLAGDPAIEYVVVTKNDGFSIVIDRSTWKIEQLEGVWRPAARSPVSSIGVSALFKKRVFQYALPFDYSGIQWGWIHVGLSLDSYNASVLRTYQSTGALTLLCGVLSLFISVFYAARLVRPIRILHSAVEKVAQGDLHARAEVGSGDEVERLAETFNLMARTILGRNQILESVSFAAKQFLTASDPDQVAREVLERIGQATRASHAYLLKVAITGGSCRLMLQQEWSSPAAGAVGEPSQPLLWGVEGGRGQGADHFLERLKAGQVVTAKPSALDPADRDSLDPRIKSMIVIPVVVVGVWWGAIGLDDYTRDRDWSDAETDSLRALADILGASIARQRAQSALQEANETLEQRVLERTSELQRAQQLLAQNVERLDLALECAEEALWDWNVPEKRTHYSDRWSRMLGFSPEDVGNSVEIWERLVHPDDLAAVQQKLAAHLAGESETYQAEFRMKSKAGAWRWIRSRGKVVARGADGAPLRITGTHLDITANKQAEDTLLELSRHAGMAEIATGVLHNVGNVLNSLNVSTSLVAGKIRDSRVDHLVSLIQMLQEHRADLSQFFADDPKGQRVLPYLAKLGDHFRAERQWLLHELTLLSSHVDHIKQIVATQQNYAKVSGVVEKVCLSDLVEDALRILGPGMADRKVKVERDFERLPPIFADKHQILQIVLNLLRNAKQAVKREDPAHCVIRIRIRRVGEGRVRVAIQDTGVGLLPENLTRIFAHGFTTKADGHGFGLHSCALAAGQMGGSLHAQSAGLGRGATFILELPLTIAEAQAKSASRFAERAKEAKDDIREEILS